VKADLEPYGVVEQFPKMEGRQLIMVLAPKKSGAAPKKKPAAAKPAGEKPAAEKPAEKATVKSATSQ
jgi:hypothetical protein